MEPTGIAFVVSTLVLGVAVLHLTRRRNAPGQGRARRASDVSQFVDAGAQADLHIAAGRHSKARSVLESALRLNPDRIELRDRLERIEADRK